MDLGTGRGGCGERRLGLGDPPRGSSCWVFVLRGVA